jgi:hypothetical protein
MAYSFDVKETATNAVTTATNKLSNSSLAKDLSASIPQTASQLQAAANKVRGQVSNALRDPFGAINVDISQSLKAQSIRTTTTKVDVAPPYPNILNIFASYTYIFTLSALSDDEIIFLILLIEPQDLKQLFVKVPTATPTIEYRLNMDSLIFLLTMLT